MPRPAVTRIFKVGDPKIDRALDEVYLAVQQRNLQASDLDVIGLAREIGKTMTVEQFRGFGAIYSGENSVPIWKIDVVPSQIVPFDQQAFPALQVLQNTGNSATRGTALFQSDSDTCSSNTNSMVFLELKSQATGTAVVLRLQSDSTSANVIFDGGSAANLDSTGAWNNGCSEAIKTDLTDLDGDDVLDKISQLRLPRWQGRKMVEAGDPTHYHFGPSAEDFHRIFGFGRNKSISSYDLAAVGLRGVQRLDEKVTALETENAQLKTDLAALTARVTALETA